MSDRTWKALARIETVISLWKALPIPGAAMIGTAWTAILSHWSWPVALLSAFASFALVAWGGYALVLINERHAGRNVPRQVPGEPFLIEDVQTAVSVYDVQGGASVEVRLIAVNFLPDDVDVELSARLDSVVENVRTESRETIPAFTTKAVSLRGSITRDQKAALLQKGRTRINVWATAPNHDRTGYTIVDVPVRNHGHLS